MGTGARAVRMHCPLFIATLIVAAAGGATPPRSRPPTPVALLVEDLPTTTQERLAPYQPPATVVRPLVRSVLARDAAFAAVAPDGTSLFIANYGRGARLVTLPARERVRLPVSFARQMVFSPTSLRLAAIDEEQALSVYSVHDGALLHRVAGPWRRVRFKSPNQLLAWDGCALWSIGLADGGRRERLVPSPCGNAESSGSGRLWLVAETATPNADPTSAARALYLVDTESRSINLLFGASAEDPIAEARLVGERFACFVRRPRAQPGAALYCIDLAGRGARLVAAGPVASIVADDGQSQLGFLDLDSPRTASLFVADLDAWSLRRLGPTGASTFAFLPGGRRLVGFDGGRGGAVLLDVGGRFRLELLAADEPVTSIAVVPGTDRRLLAIRAHKGWSELVDLDGLPE
ncbi:MAG: hypothetical protein HY903_23870 [Deltaproteobacteria bacterium]|nr:hypothetical protein [Deltaproteobacteria bacterium]